MLFYRRKMNYLLRQREVIRYGMKIVNVMKDGAIADDLQNIVVPRQIVESIRSIVERMDEQKEEVRSVDENTRRAIQKE